MKAFIVFAHPESKSFNGILFRAAAETLTGAGHEVRTSDLYGMKFNPVSDRKNFLSVKDAVFFKQQAEEQYATEIKGFAPDLEEEMQKLEWCDFMLWQFPLWWFALPGVLKGWVDRAFAMGRTYGGGRVYEKGVFRGKRAMLSLTTGGPDTSYAREGFNGDICAILRPIHRGMLQFVGFDVLAPHIVYGPARLPEEAQGRVIAAFKERLSTIEKETPVEVGRY